MLFTLLRTPTLRKRQIVAGLAWSGLAGIGALTGYLGTWANLEAQEREITVFARQYAYEPAVIRVNRGDTVHLRLKSLDVVHGFYLEGHDIDATIRPMQKLTELRRPSRPGEMEQTDTITFVANKTGKFRYRCSQTCGFMHPFMLGELIVGPNRLLWVTVGLTVGLLLGFVTVPPVGSRGRT